VGIDAITDVLLVLLGLGGAHKGPPELILFLQKERGKRRSTEEKRRSTEEKNKHPATAAA
jgi:hypothetical protein